MIYPILKSGKIIGMMDTDNSIYVSDRNKNHVFHIFGNGFGLSIRVLNILKQYDIKEVIIRYEGIKELKCLVSDFFEYGKRWIDNSQESSRGREELNGRQMNKVLDNIQSVASRELLREYPDTIKDEQLILPLEYFNKGQEVLI